MATKNQRTYSRDKVVSELTSFYECLVELYLPSSALKYPPQGGWPDITPEYLAFMEKNDTIVDIIRHIPFIRQDEDSKPYQIYEKTSAVDYNGGTFHGIASLDKPYPDVADPLEEMTTLPSHVVTLAKTSGGRDGYYIFLDTERGTITYCDFQDGPEHTDLSQVGVKPGFHERVFKSSIEADALTTWFGSQ
ncbi:hypothetical protein OEA41_000846 [Lepraria neglecta]|uniref:Uncharacterized protein n=1 Tax=Lepraria neglecta TaxID=209136 RepID=A0AAD9ZGE4_9LECA|nr:hypothetical protein OEA41_000846 [Lepraria neglecta]